MREVLVAMCDMAAVGHEAAEKPVGYRGLIPGPLGRGQLPGPRTQPPSPPHPLGCAGPSLVASHLLHMASQPRAPWRDEEGGPHHTWP